jgi:hypothetical protein
MSTEPVLTAGTITGVIIALAAIFLPGIDAGTIETAIASVLPIIAAIFARAKVTPTA